MPPTHTQPLPRSDAFHLRYPVDTGLFVSGAMDGVVKLWDTNTLEVVLEFDFKEKVRREGARVGTLAVLPQPCYGGVT